MRFAKCFFVMTLALFACAKKTEAPATVVPDGPSLSPAITGDNVMTMTVDGSTCNNNASYPNKPCVSLKICSPGTTTCQTVNDILLDTGSTGLRIFKSVLTVPLTQVTIGGGGNLAECAAFGDGSKDWGPIMTADLVLGNEPAAQVPIHVIDKTFVGEAANCSNSDSTPAATGFNGILGLGLLKQDCGTSCTTGTPGPPYYSCTGSSCAAVNVPLASQVTNPVSALANGDQNGVIIQLPALPAGGAKNASGYVVIGIGTRSNNTLTGTKTYKVSSPQGQYAATFNGTSYQAFTDTGSNGIFFPSTTIPQCANYAGLFCPASNQALSVVTTGLGALPASATVNFTVGNFSALAATPFNAFAEIGGKAGSFVDLGLPFFLGRPVAVGIESTTSDLGTGPYWAY